LLRRSPERATVEACYLGGRVTVPPEYRRNSGPAGRLTGEASRQLEPLVLAISPWFDTLPYPARLVVIGVAATLLSLVLVLVVGGLGLL
jgi:hypothetical protein